MTLNPPSGLRAPITKPVLALLLTTFGASAQLLVDFNSTSQDSGPHPEAGYNSFDAAHENSAQIAGVRNFSAFGSSVAVSVDFPDSTGNRVEQMIDRGGGNDANWSGNNINLLTDWIGVDTRTGNGGNGNYNGVIGSPTRIAFTVENLPGGNYHWRSYHHDTEHMNGLFLVEFSTNGGGAYTPVTGPGARGAFRQTDSTPGGSPASAQTYNGIPDPDPANLPSTVDFDFTAVGGQDVMVRVIPLSSSAGVHAQFAVINGFEITQISAPDAPTNLQLSNATVSRSATIGTLVGTFTTTDPTPGDTFTYTLVSGTGDSNNGDFDIVGDQLRSDRDLTVYAAGAQLTIRVRTTDAVGNALEKAFSIEVVNDSDGDGLDDDWELTYFASLTVATGAGNNDGDRLTNLQEQTLGSNPTLSDTDSDGLNDDLENGTGIFNGPGDPGSSPLLPDTDGDGLSDALEVSTANGHITDPNLTDTDGDNFSDPVEIAEGTDPNNAGDFPNIVLPLVLNEIMTRNGIGLRDGFDTREDWIEIYNPNPASLNLDNYFLTDDAAQLMKWSFPSVTIPGSGYLIVFASGINQVDPAGNPHTNFQLNSTGEYLAIVRPDGTTIDDAFHPTYAEQFSDISYGPQSTDGALRFFGAPTPGTANGTGLPGVVKDTNFDFDRGFYNVPFVVTITSATPGATIRYTTDGLRPSETVGTIYSGPVAITNTTSLRAIAYLPGWLSTNVDTQTYIFANQVARQRPNPPGWPTDWSNSGDPNSIHPADYEMDPRVVNNTLPGYSVPEALLDIPSVSIAMKPSDFLNSEAQPATGMYSNPRSRFERPCSIEYIRPDGVPGFQYDAKIEVHGNASRRAARMHKHSLRVTFTTEFGGPGRLEYPLFPDSPVDQFNKLVLRACFTDSWGLVSWSSARYRPNDSQYFRDVWMKDSLRDMGQPSSYGNFVHLYVNGLYFGLHNLTERLEDDFYAEHLGGEKEDWEINKDLSAGGSRWNQMMSIANGSITNNTAYNSIKAYLDVENFADYMLLHFYADSEDWPHHNGYAAVNAVSGDGKFRFWCWDQEIVLDKYSWNRYGRSSGAGAPFQRLRLNEEFRLLFADRAQKHMFNGGALSEQASIDRYLGLANQIDKAIVAESARWGDTQDKTPYGNTAGSSTNIDADYYPPTINNPIYFTREQHWVVERDNVVNNYIPTLHNEGDRRSIINELRSNNLFPSINAPTFSQFGGVVPSGFELNMAGNSGTIHYTLDGSDPRLEGGAVNPGAGSIATGVAVDTFLQFEAAGWRYLGGGVAQSASNVVIGHGSYNTSDWKHPNFADGAWGTGPAMLGGDSANDISGETLQTIVDIGPGGARYPTVYFRKPFSASNAGDYTTLTIGVKRDDGAVLYLNGREIGRTNMAAGTITYSTFTPAPMSGSAESAVNTIVYTLNPGDLVNGTNVLAVELHQSSLGSGDLGMDVQLTGTKPAGPPTPVTLSQTGTVKARVLSSGEWSALTEADFIVGTPAASSNLVVAEIMYNPIGASEDAEYIELMNISETEGIDLTDVHFTGITYPFPAGFVLAPLERVVVVKSQTVFAATYPTAGITIAPGQYTGSLSNSGEELAVIGQNDADIRRFTYRDKLPWPPSADGLGYALVLVAPTSDPDHSLPESWRASVALGGSPGGTDAVLFVGDPNADVDQDGRSAFFEHVFAKSDSDPTDGDILTLGLTAFDDGFGEEDYLDITFTRNLAADDALLTVEISTDLLAWNGLQVELVTIVNNGDGTATYTYRSTFPIGSRVREFLRLRVTQW